MSPFFFLLFFFFFFFLKSGQLVIELPTVTDAGSYVCVAESGTFQIESEAAIIMVTEGCKDSSFVCFNNSRYIGQWSSIVPRLCFM